MHVPVRVVERLGRSTVLRRRGGSSPLSSLLLPPRPASNAEIFEVTADASPASLVSSFAAVLGVPRRDDIPVYQRAIPTSSTTADVKNISGKRSMSG